MKDKSARRIYLMLAGAALITMSVMGGVLYTANIQQSSTADTSRFDQLVLLEIVGLLALFVFVAWAIRRYVAQLAERTEALHCEIAERNKMEAALLESERRFMDVLHTSGDAILLIDGETFVDCNKATARMLGYSNREEFLMTHPSELSPSTQPDGRNSFEKANEMIGTAFKKGFHRFEWMHRKADGENFPVEVSLTPIPYQGRTILHCLWRDLTEHKRAEQRIRDDAATLESNNLALEKLNEAAETANRAKSEFLANMSHEIRTPMTAILGFADILMGSLTDREQLDAATTIKQNGEYLIGIINDILDLSKVEAGKLEIEHIQCSPCQILSEVVSLMRVRAGSKNLSVEVECDGPIPESIQSDPTRLRQILINLAGNAVKFTEVGDIRLVVRLLDAASDAPKMQFEVVDSGMGMTQEQVANLFQPFQQADASTTRKFGGTGLGLTISKRLADKLGGDIAVTSTFGKGSTFTVTVGTGPLEGVKLLDKSTETRLSTGPDKKPTTPKAKLDCRVLLVEDSPDNQRLLSFLLKKAGAEVALAENGQMAHDLALAARDEGIGFDVILMDMQMPVMDGYEATAKLREAGYTGPIIAQTAHAMSSDREKCLHAGCDDSSTKPIDRKQLIELVRRYSQDARSAQGQRRSSKTCESRGQVDAGPRGEHRNVLIVDDHRSIRHLFRSLLSGSYTVREAVSGEEAIEIAARWMPDLVLLDITMPGIDGYETCRRLKTNAEAHPPQVIMVSGKTAVEEQVRAFEVGADDFLIKPVDPAELRMRIDLHFRFRDNNRTTASLQGQINRHHGELQRIAASQTEKLLAIQEVAVFTLAKVAESRDNETGNHLLRLRAYAQRIAQELEHHGPYILEIDAPFLADLYCSSPLHDIGKVGIPDAILLKPDQLTPVEFDVMKRHTVIGANILHNAVMQLDGGGFLAMASMIAQSHHEWWDGTGYQAGLVRDEIPLPARIVSVADVFDALTSERPYKEAWSPDVAKQTIDAASGTQFDPAVVTAFDRCFDDLVQIQSKYDDKNRAVFGAIAFQEYNVLEPA